jgi:fatty acid-binding protein DegV
VIGAPGVEHVWVLHGDAPDVDAFIDLLTGTYRRDQIDVALIGPVVGTHGGPRVMGVCYQVPS